jgi:CRP-like cAMP-binding protein
MPRGRKTSFTIHLTPAQRQTLRAWQRSTAVPAGLARRSRMILLLANGMTITDIADTVGMTRPHAYKWIRRFMQDGVEGLIDKPQRRGRNRQRRPDPRDQDDVDVVF